MSLGSGPCPASLPSRRPDSLGVQLVEGPVHPHGHSQLIQAPVLTDLLHHGSHTRPTELGGSLGHGLAHLQDHQGIVRGQGQPQVLQDGSDLPQGQAVTGDRKEESSDRQGPASAPALL